MDAATLQLLSTPVGLLAASDLARLGSNAAFDEWFPSDASAMLDELLEAKRKKIEGASSAKPVKFEAVATSARGRSFASEVRAWPLQHDQHGPVWVLEASDQRKAAESKAMLQSFSKVIDQNNRALAREKRKIADLLDHMGQAVFAIDDDLNVVDPVSAHSRAMFGEEVVGSNLAELLFGELLPEDRESATSILYMLLGSDDLQWDVLADELPRRLHFGTEEGRRSLRVNYSAMYGDDELVEKILVVVEDVTELESATVQAQRERDRRLASLETVEALVKVGPRQATDFFENARELIRTARSPAVSHEERMRALHTLKGNARVLSLTALVSASHEAESKSREASREVEDALERLEGELSSAMELGTRFLEAGQKSDISSADLETEHLERIRKAVSEEDTQSLYIEVRKLLSGPVEEMWGGLSPMVSELAEGEGKQVELVLPEEASGHRLDRRLIRRMRGALIHMVRNAIDHGFETPEERRAAGKSEVGQLKLVWKSGPAGCELHVEDDGRGMDLEKLGRDGKDPIEAAFSSGVSTKDEVTELSGRGVGLDAVKAEIEAMGGAVDVDTAKGRGTRFLLRLPIDARPPPS